jgi:hypothetical protein
MRSLTSVREWNTHSTYTHTHRLLLSLYTDLWRPKRQPPLLCRNACETSIRHASETCATVCVWFFFVCVFMPVCVCVCVCTGGIAKQLYSWGKLKVSGENLMYPVPDSNLSGEGTSTHTHTYIHTYIHTRAHTLTHFRARRGAQLCCAVTSP